MIFYTDGSAHPNPGPGGYGVVGIEHDKVFYTSVVEQIDESTQKVHKGIAFLKI